MTDHLPLDGAALMDEWWNSGYELYHPQGYTAYETHDALQQVRTELKGIAEDESRAMADRITAAEAILQLEEDIVASRNRLQFSSDQT